jgi:3-hydroxybutyryl-CoA dehydrogenase
MKTIAVLGAGQLGAGIAYCALLGGCSVLLADASARSIDNAQRRIRALLDKAASRSIVDQAAAGDLLDRLTTSVDLDDIARADVVIEAACERLEKKLQVLRDAWVRLPEHTLLVTNTSSNSITRLAAAVGDPTTFAGMQFFHPVPAMPLVELIPGVHTSEATMLRLVEVALDLGKQPVVVKNAPGFVVNRLLCPMLNEAILALQDGLASAQDIDRAMRLGASHPMGPLALADYIGLDTLLTIMEALQQQLGESKYRPARLLRELVEAGHLGKKTGKGLLTHGAAAG